ncbi:hypothetical protein R1T16_18265 [Flavobacterium sp. DG1-102-2]|uniref:hypothetical protein n=1 Tax=Flavobacterium sp. DG1-102-2 TaxID=3081663 RepID=UPI002949D4F4|nr:hypothetical protein [Flavobacterium sp. DG1-102-2]MDV6170386.1 hypothetical protein [Flavobacterium sp. DG1-102-2]
MRKITIYVFIMVLFTAMKCDDDFVSKSTNGRVTGRVFDQWNNIPFVNMKLAIAEYNYKSHGITGEEVFVQYLTDTTTDAEGYYDVSFVTSGKGDRYYVVPLETDESVFTYYYEPELIKVYLNIDSADINFLHLYPCSLKVTVADDLSNFPIKVATDFQPYTIADITEAGSEVTRQLHINKNAPTTLYFYKGTQHAVFTIPVTNTTDATEYSVNLRNEDFKDM